MKPSAELAAWKMHCSGLEAPGVTVSLERLPSIRL
jgi:hypothetical protein